MGGSEHRPLVTTLYCFVHICSENPHLYSIVRFSVAAGTTNKRRHAVFILCASGCGEGLCLIAATEFVS